MTDTNQLPPLPNTSKLFEDDNNIVIGYTADQMRAYALQAIAQATQAEVTDELLHPEDFNVEVVMKPMGGFAPVSTQGVRVTHKPTGISVTCDAARSQHTNRHHAFEQLRAILALRPAAVQMTPLTDAQMENGRDQIFSINNPYCPCDRKTFKKVAQWVERHHKIGITAQAKKEGV